MAKDIAQWLEELGLGRYAQAFVENGIDFDVLAKLSEENLKELGLTLGDRLRVMAAIESTEQGSVGDAPSKHPTVGVTTRPEAERRQLTVLFCDLVDSTALSARLDPEDMRDVLRAYQDVCAGVIARYDGYVAKFMGDGVLAYFGWPQAHEDDPERSVRAALEMVSAVAGSRELAGRPLSVRIGIATGIVVVGDLVGEGAAQEQAVVGETPNMAARLQALAEPGQIVVSETTRRLLGATFNLANLGPQSLKGFDEPQSAFAVIGEQPVESRFEARTGPLSAPMVGRDQELSLLLERWRRAKAGEGQAVLLVGEAGIGKSRICGALFEAVADEPHTRVHVQCSPYYSDSALWPIIRQISAAARISPGEPADAALDKLEDLLSRGAGRVESSAPLIAALLGLDSECRYEPLELTPQAQRARTLAALVDQLLGHARSQPVLVLVEDVHWIDSTTLEWLGLALDAIVGARILMIIDSRPEGQPTFPAHSHLTSLTLNRLDRAGIRAIVARQGGERLSKSTIDTIIARTDGVPLYAEELTKAILESGSDGEMEVPASLQDSLMARLDRVPEAKAVAQAAACIGREFDYALLDAVADYSRPHLDAALNNLMAAELIFARGTSPAASYVFKHALVQDAAYASLLRSTRRKLHERIAQSLESDFPETVEQQPELLSQHYIRAGNVPKALQFLHRAGLRALQRSANVEAVEHLSAALRLLEDMPSTADRSRWELAVLEPLGTAYMLTKGYSTPEPFEAFARAWKLCQELGEAESHAATLNGLYVVRVMRAEYQEALPLAEEMYRLARTTGDPEFMVQAAFLLGQVYFLMGDLRTALARLEMGIETYDPKTHYSFAMQSGALDPGVACLGFAAWTLWHLGYPDQALDRARRGLALADNLAHPHSRVFATFFLTAVSWFRRERNATLEQAEATISIAAEQGFPQYRIYGTAMRGWALGIEQQAADGIRMLRQSIDELQALGSEVVQPYLLAMLAEIHGARGEFSAAREVIARALALVDRTSERAGEAELHRLDGELALRQSGSAEADAAACFERALAIAREQQAKSWELRAATRLARLWHSQGSSARAREVLAPVCGWFTEGFETPDLQEAKALLDELA